MVGICITHWAFSEKTALIWYTEFPHSRDPMRMKIDCLYFTYMVVNIDKTLVMFVHNMSLGLL